MSDPAVDLAAGAPAANWYEGADADTIGYLQNRGLDKDAKTAAFAAIKAHREAEKLIGAPADQMLRLPKEPNAPEWNQVYQRLGTPAEAKDYDFANAKFADGSLLEQSTEDALRATFHTNNLSKAAAAGVAADVVKHLQKMDDAAVAANQAEASKAQADLKALWGPNYTAQMQLAENSARALGLNDEAIAAIRSLPGVGAVKAAEMFAKIASKIGEDVFIRGQGSNAGGVLTKEAAIAQYNELKNDKAWVDRFNAGDQNAKKQYNDLTAIMAGM